MCCPMLYFVTSKERENKMGCFSLIIFQDCFVSSDELSGPGSDKSYHGGEKKNIFLSRDSSGLPATVLCGEILISGAFS